ncbi:hypothetical protein JOJ88_004621 [Pantoea cypripedii]|nr:hypothetical protein [Pantoea cypripedii]
MSAQRRKISGCACPLSLASETGSQEDIARYTRSLQVSWVIGDMLLKSGLKGLEQIKSYGYGVNYQSGWYHGF